MNGKPAIQLWLPWTIEGKPSEEETTAECPSEEAGLMERVVERDNLFRAFKQVQSNGGSPGRDGRTVGELAPDLKEHWPRLKQALLEGTYHPQPVKRVEVPKPQGGVRKLGVPTVVDRFIQQAVMQVLQAQWDPTFSDSSFGFRPGRNAHQAVKRAQSSLKAGDSWVVDMDLEKFFDRVNHDKLRSEVSTRVRDRRVLTLIHRFLKAGAMEHEARHETVDGVPQRGPRSPLLSNLLLDRLDRELARRGHRFVRYADDSNVYVRSKRAGYRVLGSLNRFLCTRLKLKVNEAKSAVGRPWERTFLGFRFTRRDFRRCISPEAVKRLKERVREITRRTQGRRIERVAQELRRYLLGWKAYFGYAEVRSIFKEWDSWIQRRLRGYLWKQWGPRGYKALRQRGVSRPLAWNTAKSAHGPWRLSRSPALAMALPGRYFDGLGVPRLSIQGSSPPNRRGT
jgi:RNA-directed DNA polymerase